jgi:hypothetical protein
MVITNMKELEFFPPETDTNVVVNALTNALLNSTEGGSASSLNFTRLNQNLEAISDKLPVRLPPFYTLIIRSLTIPPHSRGVSIYSPTDPDQSQPRDESASAVADSHK